MSHPADLVAASSTMFPEGRWTSLPPESIGAPMSNLLASLGAGHARPFHAWSDGERLAGLRMVAEHGDEAGRAALEAFTTWVAGGVLEQPEVLATVGFRTLAEGRQWPAVDDVVLPAAAPDDIAGAYDVVIVGSGAGGGVAAHVLTQAGLDVLVVERAPTLSTAQLASPHSASARTFSGRQRLVDLPALDAIRRVNGVTEAPGSPQWNGNAMAVGGGTRVYGAMAWRFSPEDFSMAEVYGAPFVDWPIDYADLEPYYDRVERLMGVAGPSAPATYDGLRSHPYPLPAVAVTSVGQRLAEGALRLGLPTTSPPLAINSRPYDGRPACVQCALCVGHVCPADAKNGTHNTFLPRALASGRCTLVTGAAVTSLLVQPGQVFSGVTFVARGRSHTVHSRHVVLAAGAIETARLLLSSDIDDPHDQVGRYLQGHLYAGSTGLFAETVQDGIGPGPSIATTQYRHHNRDLPGGGILANDFTPTPFEAWQGLVEAGYVSAFGPTAVAELADAYHRSAVVIGPVHEVPQADSRVTLDPTGVDRLGVPLVRLDSPGPHPLELACADLLAEKASAWLVASGATQTVPTHWRPLRGPTADQHQAGTCRMGRDPKTSVTDRFGSVWGSRGLTIADGSLHPTNGGVNPVLTILANSWRVSEQLASTLA